MMIESKELKESDKHLIDHILMGLRDAFPIMLGYFSVAMAFGLLVKSADLYLKDAVLFSTVVFAGASQFMVLNMLINGISIVSIVTATFLVNFRHFIMSASLSSRLIKPHKWQIPFIAFGVTDETFSVVMARDGDLAPVYVMAVSFFSYISWGSGTVAGFLLGTIIPDALGDSLGMGLYVLFMSLLVPEIKKAPKILWVALSAGVLNSVLRFIPFIGSSWSLVLGVILSALIFSFILPQGTEVSNE
ncbi:MAG: AzlC family ABC transporter permease [Spirochaetales bacterium]|nr:AzlC family ABC transporter permease [Spirochaetales bacterium]